MMIQVMEKPLLDVVMKHADGNQSRAASWLGLNRNTLRKKLSDHKLL
jgi:Fis family transcriptional regulator